MRPVSVLILLPPARGQPATPLGWLEAARAATAERHRLAFDAAGATDVRIVTEPLDGRSFGERLRELAGEIAAMSPRRARGLIVLGGGAMPLAGDADIAAFLSATQVRSRRALANNIYSADAIAVPDARMFLDVPDLPSDNALPRWLSEVADVGVADLRMRPTVGLDLDSPLDVLLMARDRGAPPSLIAVGRAVEAANPAVVGALARVAEVMHDRRAELLVAGRTSSRTIAWLERNAACRVRVAIEERGLRASSTMAMERAEVLRPARSIVGLLLDDRGPRAFGGLIAELADAAVIDTRVLLAHRLGADESGWPALGDRLASDLLCPDEIEDPWLRMLTESAERAPIPILLGGHTLVGPGLPLIAAPRR